jgi:hypothetical protein
LKLVADGPELALSACLGVADRSLSYLRAAYFV